MAIPATLSRPARDATSRACRGSGDPWASSVSDIVPMVTQPARSQPAARRRGRRVLRAASTTSPTTMTAGPGRAAAATSPAMLARVPVTVRCRGVQPSLMTATGVRGSRPAAISSSRGPGEPGQAHQQDEGGVVGCRPGGVECLSGAGVRAGDDQRRGDPAVGHRDPGGRRDAHRGRHPRHHLDRNAVGQAVQGLLAAAAEDERVAALEPHDDVARRGRARPGSG